MVSRLLPWRPLQANTSELLTCKHTVDSAVTVCALMLSSNVWSADRLSCCLQAGGDLPSKCWVSNMWSRWLLVLLKMWSTHGEWVATSLVLLAKATVVSIFVSTHWTVARTLYVPTNCFLQIWRSDLSYVLLDLSFVLLIIVSSVCFLVRSLWKAAFFPITWWLAAMHTYSFSLAGRSSCSKVLITFLTG